MSEATVVPRLASTVIVIREGDDGRPQTYMVRRNPRSRFAADAYVFPGGVVEGDDRWPGGAPPCSGLTREEAHRRLSGRGADAPADPGESLAHHVAAVRELFEEAGILLATDAQHQAGSLLSPATCAALADIRPTLQKGTQSLSAVARDLGLEIVAEELVPFSHWVTPESSPRRFDTRFFMVEDRPGQTASHCGVETIDGVWIAPADALHRFQEGEITLVSVTADHLHVLAQFGTIEELMTFARSKPIHSVKGGRDFRSLGEWRRGDGELPW